LSTDHHQSISVLTAFILAGGRGTRLQPAFDGGPKAMAPVAGRPFLDYLLQFLKRAGITRIVLCVGYKHQQIRESAGDGRHMGLDIRYSLERSPLGTGGALALAVSRTGVEGTVLAMNGDSLAEVELAGMWRAHGARHAAATIGLVNVPNAARYGRVAIDGKGWVRRFAEKSGDDDRGTINGGVYLFESDVLKQIPPLKAVSLECEVLPRLASCGSLFSFSSPGRGGFIDIGTPEDYLRAEEHLRQLQLC